MEEVDWVNQVERIIDPLPKKDRVATKTYSSIKDICEYLKQQARFFSPTFSGQV